MGKSCAMKSVLPGLLDGKLYVTILCIIIETGFAITRGGARCCLRDRMWNTKSGFKKKTSAVLSGEFTVDQG